MKENQSMIEKLGGPGRVTILIVVFILATGFYRWQNTGSGNALQEVGAELGLQYEEVSQRRQLRGRIDDIGIAVGTTTDNTGGDTRWFTDFKIYAPDQPHGKIIGAGFRQKLIGGVQDSEWLSTGEAAFDKAVLVEGEREDMLARLDSATRPAVLGATEAGWSLEGMTWQARESGRMTNAGKIRSLLELGLAAARAMRRDEGASTASPPKAGKNDPAIEPPQ